VLKMKLTMAIIGISSIHLVFIISAAALAWIDKMSVAVVQAARPGAVPQPVQ
jgi:uncharacterized membrane protein YqhA